MWEFSTKCRNTSDMGTLGSIFKNHLFCFPWLLTTKTFNKITKFQIIQFHHSLRISPRGPTMIPSEGFTNCGGIYYCWWTICIYYCKLKMVMYLLLFKYLYHNGMQWLFHHPCDNSISAEPSAISPFCPSWEWLAGCLRQEGKVCFQDAD